MSWYCIALVVSHTPHGGVEVSQGWKHALSPESAFEVLRACMTFPPPHLQHLRWRTAGPHGDCIVAPEEA